MKKIVLSALVLLTLFVAACAAPVPTQVAAPSATPAPICPPWTVEGITVTLHANDFVTAYLPSGTFLYIQTDASCTYELIGSETIEQNTNRIMGEDNQFAQYIDPEEEMAEFTGAAIQACFLPEPRESARIESLIKSFYIDCSGFTQPDFLSRAEALLMWNVQVRIWSPTNDRVSSIDGAVFDRGEIVLIVGNSVTEFTIADPDFPEQTYQFAADSVIFSYP